MGFDIIYAQPEKLKLLQKKKRECKENSSSEAKKQKIFQPAILSIP